MTLSEWLLDGQEIRKLTFLQNSFRMRRDSFLMPRTQGTLAAVAMYGSLYIAYATLVGIWNREGELGLALDLTRPR